MYTTLLCFLYAQIWNVSTAEPEANFRGHCGRVLCVQWSDSDADVIYSGGQDNTLQCWRISDQQHTKPLPGVNGVFAGKKSKNKPGKKTATEKSDMSSSRTSTCSSPRDAAQQSHDPTANMAELQQLLDTKKKELVRELREGGAADAVTTDAPSAENPITDNSVSDCGGFNSYQISSFDFPPHHVRIEDGSMDGCGTSRTFNITLHSVMNDAIVQEMCLTAAVLLCD